MALDRGSATGRESSLPPSAQSTYDGLAREQYQAHFAALRRPMVTLVAVAVFGVLGALASSAQVSHFVQQPLRPVLPLIWLGIAIELAMHWLHGRLGALHPLHVALERTETLLITLIGVVLIALGGSVLSAFWIVPLSQNLLCRIVLNRRYTLAANGACYLGLVLGFVAMGQPGDGLVAAALATVGMAAQWTLGRGEVQRLQLETRRQQMRDRVAELTLESERARLARELHDGVTADLAGLMWRLRAEGPGEAEMARGITLVIRELRDTVQELRVGDHELAQGRARDAAAGNGTPQLQEPTAQAIELQVAALRARRGTVPGALLRVPVPAAVAACLLAALAWGTPADVVAVAMAAVAALAGARVLRGSDALRLHSEARAELQARQLEQLERQHIREHVARALDATVLCDLDSLIEEVQSLAASEPLSSQDGDSGPHELLSLALQAREGLQQALWDVQQEQCTMDELLLCVQRKCRDLCGSRIDWSAEADFQQPSRHARPQLVAGVVRMVQEAVRNALRHANPSRIDVRLRADDDLHLEIRDDGAGLSRERFETSAGGLRNLRLRAQMLGGRMELAPTESGTLLVANLPG